MGGDNKYNNPETIVFFDGVCNLCNKTVDFIIRKDRKNQFVFAALQSKTAKKMLAENPKIHLDSPDSFVLLDNGQLFQKSTAAIKVLSKLGFPFSLFIIFLIFPAFIRNPIYAFIAKNRYKIWGKRETCRIPTEAERLLFLD
ncbi:MAG: DUF393 domain-containing protein [Flavobacteriales bacterium]|nr:DUF393 domain-containing protein [Flavobacteriales bacterium]